MDINLVIPEQFHNHTLYEYLKDLGLSRQNIVNLKYTDSGMYANGERIKTNYILSAGETITLSLIDSASEKIIPVELNLDIIYEDADVVIVNKPAGMPCHPSLNNYDNTLANALAYYYKKQGIDFTYRCINRLDRDTTGPVIIAKHMISAAILNRQHQNGALYKEYTAICEGSDLEGSGVINLPIGRVDGSTITRRVDTENGEEAITHYEVLKSDSGQNVCVVRLFLDTGRTHQIRVHMSYIGHPLIGDFLYNPDNHQMDRQALHVNKIEFNHPLKAKRMVIQSDLPRDMESIIDSLH